MAILIMIRHFRMSYSEEKHMSLNVIEASGTWNLILENNGFQLFCCVCTGE